MADNLAVTPGTGATVAADDVGSVLYQRIKIDLGSDGVSIPAPGSARGLVVDLAGSGIVSGRKAVTTAGTALQFTVTPTTCKSIVLNADLGNSNPVVVGDSSVVAANGSQKGIVLVPGNPPIELRINDISLLYVDAQTNGDAVTYAYLT